MSTSGLYRWAKLGWNLCCYACCILSLLRNTHSAPRNRYMKTWRPAENRKYITYRYASRWEPSHGHMQHVQNIGDVRLCGFGVMQSDRQTDRRTTDILITILRTPTVLQRTMCIPQQRWNTISILSLCQLYSITAYGGCLHSLWMDLGYMFQSV